jgi:hypothetical protein
VRVSAKMKLLLSSSCYCEGVTNVVFDNIRQIFNRKSLILLAKHTFLRVATKPSLQ